MDCADFKKYLQESIKAGGKTSSCGNYVSLEITRTKINIITNVPFSKSYVKKLAKKYLLKKKIKDLLIVVAYAKDAYELRYLSTKSRSTRIDFPRARPDMSSITPLQSTASAVGYPTTFAC